MSIYFPKNQDPIEPLKDSVFDFKINAVKIESHEEFIKTFPIFVTPHMFGDDRKKLEKAVYSLSEIPYVEFRKILKENKLANGIGVCGCLENKHGRIMIIHSDPSYVYNWIIKMIKFSKKISI